jgi:hypothetical protein
MLSNEFNRVVTTTGIGDNCVTLFLQRLTQIESDDRFVFGNNNSGD